MSLHDAAYLMDDPAGDAEALWVDDHLEAYLDGALPPDEAARVDRFLAVDDAAGAELLLAERIRDGLRTLPQAACPPEVTRAVVGHARRAARAAWHRRLLDGWDTWWQTFGRPSLATATLLLVVVTASLVGRPAAPPPADDVAEALAEVQWTLAFLSEVGRETGAAVRHDVLEAHLVAPMQQALGRALDPTTPPDQPALR